MVTEAGRQACLVPVLHSCSWTPRQGAWGVGRREADSWQALSPAPPSLSGSSGNRPPVAIREGLVCARGGSSLPGPRVIHSHLSLSDTDLSWCLLTGGRVTICSQAPCLMLSLRWAQLTQASGIQMLLHTHTTRSGGDGSLTKPGRAWVTVLKPVLSGEKKRKIRLLELERCFKTP